MTGEQRADGPGDDGQGSVEFNPKALLVTVGVAVAVGLYVAAQLGALPEPLNRLAAGMEGRTFSFDSLPQRLSTAALEEQRIHLDADEAFQYVDDGETVRAFSFEVAPHSYSVAFYFLQNDEYRLMDGHWNATGYDGPALVGTPQRLGMRERRLDVGFVFQTHDGLVNFVQSPDQGPWDQDRSADND